MIDDGDFSIASQTGPIIKSLDQRKRSIIYRQPMIQEIATWVAAERSIVGPDGGFLVEESAPEHVGGGLCKWDRVFAEVPSSRDEFEPYVHAYQFVIDGAIAEMALPVKSTVAYSYERTTSPEDITILRAYRLAILGGIIYATGDAPTPGEPIIATDTQVERWMGDIFEIRTRYVPEFSLSLL